MLTNHHVAGRTRAITCTLADREEVPADLVGTDPLSDLAVLEAPAGEAADYPGGAVRRLSKLRVGDPVLALGSPLALSQSVTMGIVSNTEMILPGMFWPFNRMTLDGEDVGSIVRWIGHDAPIFGGNSGGPLVNMAGEIVGVNEISLGLAGAIPADLAREVSAALIREGRVRRSWIGLDVQPLLKNDRSATGALVGSTIEGSPAAKAGFVPGDLLVRLDGRAVNVQFAEEVPLFNQMVMRLPLGRAGRSRRRARGTREDVDAWCPIERANVESHRSRRLPELGITASNLSLWSAKELRRANHGRRTRTGRPARRQRRRSQAVPAGRRRDCRGGREADANRRGVDGVLQQTSKGPEGPVPALVAFDRAGERLLTVVSVGGSALDDPGREATKAWLPVAPRC